MTDINHLLAGFTFSSPPTDAELQEFLRLIGINLPEDYLRFLNASNGASGEVGGRFVRLDTLKEVLEITRAHQLFAKKLLHIGSDGGEVAYCWSFKQSPGEFVSLGYYETRSKALPARSSSNRTRYKRFGRRPRAPKLRTCHQF